MNNKGFILTDALLSLLIVSSISILILVISKVNDKAITNYYDFENKENGYFVDIFNEIKICEGCILDDLS